MSNQPNPFDAWFEDAHRCDIQAGYCHTHDSAASEEGECYFAQDDPLHDPHDIFVEDEMIEALERAERDA